MSESPTPPSSQPPGTPRSYLTHDVPGIGGRLKVRPEDFLVEELPAYHPSGEGEHLYLFVQKIDMATGHLVRLIADHYGVPRHAVGVAGLKDKRAVTTQLVSVHLPGKKETDFPPLQHTSVSVLWSDRHANKLRRGHLHGNRFIIRVRDVEPGKVVHAMRTMSILARRGVPNRIGPQRFGVLANNHEVGRALLRFDHQAALDALLGPSERFPQFQRDARIAYAEGRFADAFDLLPRSMHTERRVLSFLMRGRNARDACRAIEPMEYSFYLTALQSAAFNRVLDARLNAGTFDRLLLGDLAFKHENGAVFAVDESVQADPTTEERLRTLSISPSGPMWGAGMTRAGTTPTEGLSAGVDGLELEALGALGVTPDDFDEHARRAGGRRSGRRRGRDSGSADSGSGNSVAGVRRALRVPLRLPDIEAGVDEHGAYIKCVFELPRGAFATTVMSEIMKTDAGLGGLTDEQTQGGEVEELDES